MLYISPQQLFVIITRAGGDISLETDGTTYRIVMPYTSLASEEKFDELTVEAVKAETGVKITGFYVTKDGNTTDVEYLDVLTELMADAIEQAEAVA